MYKGTCYSTEIYFNWKNTQLYTTMAITTYLLFVLCLGFAEPYSLPVQKCQLEDAACMSKGFQDFLQMFMGGIPEIGVELLDPLQLDDFSFNLTGLQFRLKQGVFRGLKSAVIDRVLWDEKRKKIEVDYHFNGSARGHYTAGGRLLILPISGDGIMKLKYKNLSIKMVLDYNIVQDESGRDHVAPTKYSFTFEIKDGAHFNLTNLFNGNRELSDTMLTFLNGNWQQVSKEFGRPVVDAAAKKVFKNVATFFKNMPLAEIAYV